MVEIGRLLEHPVALKLGLVLAHFLWQGLAVACLALLALVVLRRARAAVRYVVLFAHLILMAGCPVVTFVVIPDVNPLTAVLAHFAAGPASQALETAPRGALLSAAPAGPSPESTRKSSPRERVGDVWSDVRPRLPWLAAGWLIGVVLLSLRLVVCWGSLARIGRRASAPGDARWEAIARLAQRLKVHRGVRLLQSARVSVPLVMGWLRPVILLPPSVLTGLTPAQLEAILAHELAHVRRHDFLVNILQTVVETLLFHHPVVWWLSHRIRAERELCCDDLAVMACGDAVGYARALESLEQLRAQTPRPALAITGGPLTHRVRRLVTRGAETQPLVPGASAICLALALGCFLVSAFAGSHHVVRQQGSRAGSPKRADQAAPPADRGVTRRAHAFWHSVEPAAEAKASGPPMPSMVGWLSPRKDAPAVVAAQGQPAPPADRSSLTGSALWTSFEDKLAEYRRALALPRSELISRDRGRDDLLLLNLLYPSRRVVVSLVCRHATGSSKVPGSPAGDAPVKRVEFRGHGWGPDERQPVNGTSIWIEPEALGAEDIADLRTLTGQSEEAVEEAGLTLGIEARSDGSLQLVAASRRRRGAGAPAWVQDLLGYNGENLVLKPDNDQALSPLETFALEESITSTIPVPDRSPEERERFMQRLTRANDAEVSWRTEKPRGPSLLARTHGP